MNKLELINSIDVIEDSASCGELEYVLVANTPENREKLLQTGVTQQEIDEATDDLDGETIDISSIGFTYTGAKWYEGRLGGFLDYVPDHAPERAKR
ncbi:hypothetical protein [Brevibacillus sp. HD3.3A]|uniref:hypothetical protein n=1 Tax=Brevibacillus sp. HD3.3A TaxID=2738979 RepID=UPI00156B57F7|nr:hypothetical protein [Brevibacillus sp. HD3.3A]UED70751.1 hypothetical protein HP435_08970 [Brevibacillus sp. HD3.3A]